MSRLALATLAALLASACAGPTSSSFVPTGAGSTSGYVAALRATAESTKAPGKKKGVNGATGGGSTGTGPLTDF
jgi:hypothetical protein